MYCSVCGAQSAPGLKYCKSCGSRIAEDNSEVTNSVAKTFATATIMVAVFGIIGFMIMIKSVVEHGGFDTKSILLISTLYVGSLGALMFFLIRLVLKMIGWTPNEKEPLEEQKESKVPLFKPADTAKLEAYREPASSVVEHTTRDLANIESERS